MLYSYTQVSAALLLAFSSIAQADRWCNIARFPGCSSPFPPGHRNMGDAWWGIGAQDAGATIKSLKTMLLVAEVPKNNKGVMAINTAFENTDRQNAAALKDETYQTLTVAYPPGWNACDQRSDQWCTFPSLYNRHSDPIQYSMPAKAVNKMTGIKLEFWYNPSDDNGQKRIYQQASVGTQISNITQEAPWQFWPKTECQCGANGVIPAHSYIQTEITLTSKVPNWGSTASFQKASASTPTSDDGGLTWKIDSIDLEDSNCSSDTHCDNVARRDLFGRPGVQPIN